MNESLLMNKDILWTITYHTAVGVSVAHEWTPVFEVLGLVSGEGHHAYVCNHVFVWEVVIHKLWLVLGVEHVEQFWLLPNSVSAQNEVLLVLSPVYIAHREVVILGHLEGALGLLKVLRSWICLFLDILIEVVKELVVETHLYIIIFKL